MVSEIHGHLRLATRAAHEGLERRVDMLRRIESTAERRALVERFHHLHTAVEAAVAPWLSGLAGLDFEARRRTPWLERDLRTLGGRAPPPIGMAPATGVAEALGLMYVLEGSTLGGRVIRRHVESHGGDMRGLSFLDPYGERAGERWRGFLAVLDGELGAPADRDAATAGALRGFTLAEQRLCEAVADA